MRTLRLPLAVIASLTLYAAFAPSALAGGGTDTIIFNQLGMSGLGHNEQFTDIASDGTVYTLLNDVHAGSEVHIYRSLDGGETWSLWGSLIEPNPVWWNDGYSGRSLHVAEGTVDRVYVAVSYVAPGYASYQVRVAFATHGDAVPSWTVATVYSTPVEDLSMWPIQLTSDQDSLGAFHLYMLLQQQAGVGRDVFFTRSVDFGANWNAPYKLTDSVENSVYWFASIGSGYGGIVHVVMVNTKYAPLVQPTSSGIVYRRALNYANGGIASWQEPVALVPTAGGAVEFSPCVAASVAGGNVLVSHRNETTGETTLRLSSDSGVSWPSGHTASAGSVKAAIARLPDGSGFLLGGLRPDSHVILRRSTEASPLALSVAEVYTDAADSRATGYTNVLTDPSRGHQAALSWGWHNNSSPYNGRRLFDAQWRGVAGYPNVKPGFPVALTAAAVSAPALANLDADPDLEIVFGDAAGLVQVYKDDGTRLAGWPRALGGSATTAPIAVGDLDDDGFNEVVAGNGSGVVCAFERDGSPLPGWPIDIGSSQPAYVGIATVTRESRYDIVVCTGRFVAAYAYTGRQRCRFNDLASPIQHPPALADLEGNLHVDILVPTASALIRYAHPSVTARVLHEFAPKTIGGAVTVGDIDGDGELETVVPTQQGDVFVLDPKGNTIAGWPFTDATMGAMTSVALASLVGNDRLELAFAGANRAVQLRLGDNSVVSGWPRTTAAGPALLSMPTVETIDGAGPDVVLPAPDHSAYAWTNLAAGIAGWPRVLGSQMDLPAASGDIDADGSVELAVASATTLYVIEVQAPLVRTNPVAAWPMFGHDPQRTQCQNCAVELVTGAPEQAGLPSIVLLQPASPNPSQGPTCFRFALPERAAVELAVYDARGRRVQTVLKDELSAGAHQAFWDGRDRAGHAVARGEYFARLSVHGPRVSDVRTRSVILTR